MPGSLRVPSLRRHKPSSLGVVTLNGKDHYLGSWPVGRKHAPDAVRTEYDRLIAEWLAAGRRLATITEGEPVTALSGNELILVFYRWAEQHYRRPDGTTTSEIADYKKSLKVLRKLYGTSAAHEFGPLRLKGVRQRMIDANLSRGVINQRVGRIVRMFKWAVGEEIILESIWRANSCAWA